VIKRDERHRIRDRSMAKRRSRTCVPGHRLGQDFLFRNFSRCWRATVKTAGFTGLLEDLPASS
jgi:hypothetical protein